MATSAPVVQGHPTLEMMIETLENPEDSMDKKSVSTMESNKLVYLWSPSFTFVDVYLQRS